MPLIPSETLTSFIFRSVQANYYESPYHLVNEGLFGRYEFDQNQLSKGEAKVIERLCWTEDLFKHSYGSTNITPKNISLVLLKTSLKFCPLCIGEQVFQHYGWGFSIVNICTRHNVYLINECSYCNKSVTVTSLFNNKCNGCGRKLSATSTEMVSNKVLIQSQVELENLLLKKSKLFCGSLDINDLINAILAFSYMFNGLKSFTECDHEGYKAQYTQKIPLNQNDLILLIADLFWLFNDFTRNFSQILDLQFQQDKTRTLRRRRQRFEEIVRGTKGLRFINNAFQEYRRKHFLDKLDFPINITSYDKEAAEYLAKHYITKEQLKDANALSDSEVAYIVKNPSFQHHFINNGKAIYFFKNQADKIILELKEIKDDLVTAVEAAVQLGVHVDRVFGLINSGELTTSHYLDGINKYLSKKQLEELIESLNVEYVGSIKNKIPLVECFNKYATSGLSLQFLIQMMQSKKLIASSVEDSFSFRGLYFDPINLADVLAENRIENKGYTLKQVSELLGFTERTILKLVEAGLFAKPKVEKLNNNAFAYRFDKENVLQTKESYRTLKQLLQEFDVSESLVRNAIHRGKIKNYLSGICRKIFVKKSEFEEYRNKGKSQ